MRAVIVHLDDAELARRRSTGLDRWDEMWEGVLHMTPAPSVEHQRILDRIVGFLEPLVRTIARGQLVSGINVFRAEGDYRIPDITFVARAREELLHADGIRGGAPDVVIEIRSPEDETYEKLPFYAARGVKEVIVVDRDTKSPELFALAGSQYAKLQLDASGSVRSEILNVTIRRLEGSRLRLQDGVDPAQRVDI